MSNMVWIKSNGKEMTARRVGEITVRFESCRIDYPLPLFNDVVTEEQAIVILRQVSDSNKYKKTK